MLKTIAPYVIAAAFAIGTMVGWFGGSTVAELDCSRAKLASDAKRDELIEQARTQEREALIAKQQASAEIDTRDAARETDVQYVDREVIKYVTQYRDRGCPVLPERVCIYNRALGLECDVPSPAGAGRPPASPAP